MSGADRISPARPLSVLYSFPQRLGLPGVGTTAWHQVAGVVERGLRVTLFCGSCERPVPGVHRVVQTMKLGPIPLSYRLLGHDRAMAWHDWLVARALWRLKHEIDLVHCWPSGALHTLRAANRAGVANVLERPSAHTAQVFESVAKETAKLGMQMDPTHYAFANQARLAHEQAEFEQAQCLLCPSEFAERTFLERGFRRQQLCRHGYGFDPSVFSTPSATAARPSGKPFTAVFVGECFPLKGLHVALEAWHKSGAAATGKFYICGQFMPAYREALSDLLAHPSVEALGFVSDVADVMRKGDVLVLPTVSEGSALVTYEARACGLVLMVSAASGARCKHGDDAMVHEPGDVGALAEQMAQLAGDPALLARLRERSIAGLEPLTWASAAERLHRIYEEVASASSRAAEAVDGPELSAAGVEYRT